MCIEIVLLKYQLKALSWGKAWSVEERYVTRAACMSGVHAQVSLTTSVENW